jgi:hypothetical protein
VNGNTNQSIRDRLRYSDDELLYDYNSITILYESIELLETLRNQFKSQSPEHVERRNGMLIFDLIVKYCTYAETLGATINGFKQSNKHTNPSSTIVLRYLRDLTYTKYVNYFEIASIDYKQLTEDDRSEIVYAFGYQKLDERKIDTTISHIYNLLKEIAELYLFMLNRITLTSTGIEFGTDII